MVKREKSAVRRVNMSKGRRKVQKKFIGYLKDIKYEIVSGMLIGRKVAFTMVVLHFYQFSAYHFSFFSDFSPQNYKYLNTINLYLKYCF